MYTQVIQILLTDGNQNYSVTSHVANPNSWLEFLTFFSPFVTRKVFPLDSLAEMSSRKAFWIFRLF